MGSNSQQFPTRDFDLTLLFVPFFLVFGITLQKLFGLIPFCTSSLWVLFFRGGGLFAEEGYGALALFLQIADQLGRLFLSFLSLCGLFSFFWIRFIFLTFGSILLFLVAFSTFFAQVWSITQLHSASISTITDHSKIM